MDIDIDKLLNKIVFVHFDKDVEDLPERKIYEIFQIFQYQRKVKPQSIYLSFKCSNVSPQKQIVFLLNNYYAIYNALPLLIPTTQKNYPIISFSLY